MEEIAKQITLSISHTLEIMAALVIAVALMRLLVNSIRSVLQPVSALSAMKMRMLFGSSVAVSLELLLGADVLATAVAPSWDDIGKLAAIAILRTGLNYFLEKELNHKKSAA
ncbi:MAG TPA: DUF1622 domain-containing protein [Ferruginibacter sp.]|nr:hypothetical protein [Chitinophagaceae bacterium]HRI24704.1 DUF1622 domain-containing protein [Ferruginibacter sp.]